MPLFQRQSDPITERERALEREMRDLEDQIAALSDEAKETEQLPRVRSTVRPRELPSQNPFTLGQEVVFEPVDNEVITEPEPLDVNSSHYNEHGVKKLNLVHLWQRIQLHLRKTPGAQSKFVNYLAAGSIQGIRPLRYERRIARNRFLMMFGVLMVVLFGIFAMLQGRF
jgi:hypothetical protein